ncbi:hypothetical protein Tsubulata_037621 [Turnera subulata]|uniref:Response regulatory domain-containing protein n=1 Tax=Turnera subulata TaxID=218843 RepID=A0A9Q0GHY0_9ROSI|nr:hypothetical protein Tsubulata_037621 [Turnera subulata]
MCSQDFQPGEMTPAIDSPVDGNLDGEFESVLPIFNLRNRLSALVIDSSISCRLIQKGLLRHYGVQTEDAEDGLAARNLIAKRSDPFDLILIDNSLPSIYNGHDTIRALRGMGITSKIVGMVICWCATVREDRMCGCAPAIREVLDAGASEVIFKPVSPGTLVAILRDLDNQF